MCSIIGGFNIPKEIKKNLFLNSESRGDDATGVAYWKDDKLVVAKTNARASDFVETDGFKKFMLDDPDLFIGHTRAKTQGEATNNRNNHPLFTENKKIALVHNGIISDDQKLFDAFSLTRRAEVDTEILLRLYEKFRKNNKPIKSLNKVFNACDDNASVAILDACDKDKIYLATNNQTLCIAYIEEYDAIVFASTKEIIEKSLVKYDYIKGFFPVLKGKIEFNAVEYSNSYYDKSESIFELSNDLVTPYSICYDEAVCDKVLAFEVREKEIKAEKEAKEEEEKTAQKKTTYQEELEEEMKYEKEYQESLGLVEVKKIDIKHHSACYDDDEVEADIKAEQEREKRFNAVH